MGLVDLQSMDLAVFYKRFRQDAGVAQLVEHHLAKVAVDGSNPFARSIS